MSYPGGGHGGHVQVPFGQPHQLQNQYPLDHHQGFQGEQWAGPPQQHQNSQPQPDRYYDGGHPGLGGPIQPMQDQYGRRPSGGGGAVPQLPPINPQQLQQVGVKPALLFVFAPPSLLKEYVRSVWRF